MKKERIVVLCLCVLLSGSLHTQWIAWAWQRALPSPAKAVLPVGAGAQPGIAQKCSVLIRPVEPCNNDCVRRMAPVWHPIQRSSPGGQKNEDAA
jgi:hypothetical protein